MAELEDVVPAGFVRLPLGRSGRDFTSLAAPWYVRDDGGRLVGGFRVLAHHLNPVGTCHGGALATFCDVLMPLSASYEAEPDGLFLPTVSLSLDYLAPVSSGAWVEGRTEVLRRGKRLVFAQARLTADEELSVRANGVFSVPQRPGGASMPMAALKALLTSKR